MFNPSLHTATNKPIGLTNKPVDARTYYYDDVNFVYRQYVSTSEVLAYLTGSQRAGHFSVIINTGGSIITDGTIVGGFNNEWWFKNGIADGNLILKDGSGGVEWGEIVGDINDQSDLITLIDSLILPPVRFYYGVGETLPYILDYTAYSAYGNDPDIQIRDAVTGEVITASATIIMTGTPGAITEITIDAANDGTGVTDRDLLIILKQE